MNPQPPLEQRCHDRLNWRKSTRSPSGGNGQTCVEIAATSSVMAVRDSALGVKSPIFTLRNADYDGLLKHIA